MAKKILIYGFNVRTARVASRNHALTLAKVLKSGYQSMGHEVTVGIPPNGLSHDNLLEYDKVFVGLGPPNAISSDRTYEALYMIGTMRGTGKLVLFLDDPDVRKIIYGLGTWVRNSHPRDVFRRAYKKRKLWFDPTLYPEDADNWATWHIETCRFLLGMPTADVYPPLLIPAYQWADVQRIMTPWPDRAKEKTVSIDPSSMVQVHDRQSAHVREPMWVTDELSRSLVKVWMSMQHTKYPILALDLMCSDADRLKAYRQSWGVLEEPLNRFHGGWWSTKATYAMSVGALYLSDPEHWRQVDSSFDFLPTALEDLSYDQRDELAAEQRNAFLRVISSKSKIKSQLQELLGNE